MASKIGTTSKSNSEGNNTTSLNGGSIITQNRDTKSLESAIDGSMRMFGLPHQFIAHNDPRIGDKSNLGRCFAERIVLEAPIICLKPGVAEFLPGMSNKKKAEMIASIQESASDSGPLEKLFQNLSEATDDEMLYYQHKSDYSNYMSKVNILCKLMAVFLGIADKKVPWAKGSATFGTYDWRYYQIKNIYNDVNMEATSGMKGSIGAFFENAINAATEYITDDTEWVRFYVDSNASFGESVSNSTTSSILESFTEKLEGIAKELDTISGISGVGVSNLANSAISSADSFIQQHAQGDGAISTFLKRISGNTKQIMSGGNFLMPEIWSQSEYSKNYSFTLTLSTPYGCAESWFLNIGVPMMHILGMALPQQLTANTYRSPYLVKAYSPGWFNCDLGIIDSLSIDKGADGSWSVGGLPNEVKISLSIKDLYSSLAIPEKPYENPHAFINNYGIIEFLMVNCGIDITQQDLSNRLKIWATILGNNFTDRLTRKPYDIQQFFKGKLQNLYKIVK